jgi:hypothetical protein
MATDAGPNAYAIFTRARAAISALQYPRSIDYTISIKGFDGSTPRENHYRANCRPGEDLINVAPISEEEAAAPPPVPKGFSFAFTASICGGHCETGVANVALPAGRHAASPDLIGVPLLAPTYMFGLPYNERGTDQQTSTKSKIPTIAVVSSSTRDYRVTLADTPVLDGSPSYHLLLTPLRRPHENRLRELWIGAADYLPRKAVIAGNFTIAPLVDVPWTVRFAMANGVPFISSETSDATLYLANREIVRNATISFENIRDSDRSLAGRPLVQPLADSTTLTEPQPH